MLDLNLTLPIITLNIQRPNPPIQRQRLNPDKKAKPSRYCL